MNSFSTILIIVVVLVVCLVTIAIIQKREQEKALLMQKKAQFRYRAAQASNILNNFNQLPIGTEARVILMQYSLVNLKAIEELDSSDSRTKQEIASLEKSLQSPDSPADKQKLVIPSDMALLTKQISQLSTLTKFIIKLHRSKKIKGNTAPVAVNKLMSLISESKICAYIQLGKEALLKHEYVPAQRNFLLAQQMMSKIVNKNDRISRLEAELLELIKSTPTDAMNGELSIGEAEQPAQAVADEGDPFGPKKKW